MGLPVRYAKSIGRLMMIYGNDYRNNPRYEAKLASLFHPSVRCILEMSKVPAKKHLPQRRRESRLAAN